MARVLAEAARKQPMFAQASYLALWRDRGDMGRDQGVACAGDLDAE